MVQISKKVFIGLFLISLCILLSGPSLAKPKHSFVVRKWVVKLKQNSYFNRRPFQFASPAPFDDKVFVGIHREIFYGIDAKKGKKVWKFKTEGPIHSQARVEGDIVYFADMKGTVYALDKNTGKPVWRNKPTGPVMSAPLIAQNKVCVVSLTKELSCLDLKDGHILWQQTHGTRETEFTIKGSADPVLVGDLILVGFSDGALAAYSIHEGILRWAKQLGNPFQEFHDVDSTPFIVKGLQGEVAYVSSADGRLFALNPQNGQILWDADVGGVNDAFFAEPFLYVTAGGVVYCFKAKSGEILWEQDLEIPESSSPVVYKDWLVVVATKGRAYFLDKNSGDILYSWYVRGGSYSDPVMEGKRVYILSNAGRLYAFEFKK